MQPPFFKLGVKDVNCVRFLQGVGGGDLDFLEEGKVGKVLSMLQTFYNELQDSSIKVVSFLNKALNKSYCKYSRKKSVGAAMKAYYRH
jgi:hypothetical protein